MRKRFNFQTLWTSNIQRYSVNLQNFHGWLVTRSWQQNKIKNNMGNTAGATLLPKPLILLKALPWWKITYFCNCLLWHQIRFLYPVLPPCPLSGSLLQPAKGHTAHKPTTQMLSYSTRHDQHQMYTQSWWIGGICERQMRCKVQTVQNLCNSYHM
jgi:hypothetical protein